MKSIFLTFSVLFFAASSLPPGLDHPGNTILDFQQEKPRVMISTDIGGTDPDDFQSLIHYLMYADRFQTEGLISSPYGEGRAKHIHQILCLYDKDLPKLKAHSDFPESAALRDVVKQGAIDGAPPQGWSKASEGSDWIIERARIKRSQPLWVLVWGGIEDVAQALHDAPDIAENIRVYWIGGPNKKWSVNAYLYITENFPDLWIIEANSTYRGWFMHPGEAEKYGNKTYFERVIKGRGAMGDDFASYYSGELKMGDTPSVAYLLNGSPNVPKGESWGGSFDPLLFSAKRVFRKNTTITDTVPVYSVIEWKFQTKRESAGEDSAFWFEIDGQRIDGFHGEDGSFSVRFVPKKPGHWQYVCHSSVKELDGMTGSFTSVNPWPGAPLRDNISPLKNWWSDKVDENLYLGDYQGAQTISKWRKAYLSDWEERWKWLE